MVFKLPSGLIRQTLSPVPSLKKTRSSASTATPKTSGKVELAIFSPGPPTVITAANGFGGWGRNSQKSASRASAAKAIDETTTTARTRCRRDRPDDGLNFGVLGCNLNPCGSIRFTRANKSVPRAVASVAPTIDRLMVLCSLPLAALIARGSLSDSLYRDNSEWGGH